MFCTRFFANRYFAPRYWTKIGQDPAPGSSGGYAKRRMYRVVRNP